MDRTQIEQAIAALETQRHILGDAVVDASLVALRQQLAALIAPARSVDQQRKQATILFADLSGFTALSERMDAEDVTELMNALWSRLDQVIVERGGYIDKHIGDAVMALWGVGTAREDYPEQATRAALGLHAAVAGFAQVRGIALQIRVGINTGPVLFSPVGTTAEYTALGDAVNIASRLEHAAPLGGVLVSHDTYRHVRGLFDVEAQAPLTVKGKSEPLSVYLVQREKPRAFRQRTRWVEGIETRMVGREGELQHLRDAYADVVTEGSLRMVTVVGDAGLGKYAAALRV